MGDNYARWLGTAVLMVGLSAAALAGAGVVTAEESSASGDNSTKSSTESSDATGRSSATATDEPSKRESDISEDGVGTVGRGSSGGSTSAPPPKVDEEITETPAGQTESDDPPALPEPVEPTEPVEPVEPSEPVEPIAPAESVPANSRSDDETAALNPETAHVVVLDDVSPEPDHGDTGQQDPSNVIPGELAAVRLDADASFDVAAVQPLDFVAADATPVNATAMTSTPMLFGATVSPTATASPITSLVTAISTLIFNLYALAARVLSGPPQLPPGSTVTVRSTTLRIDCGDGYDVPADWYIPAGANEDPPERLIYLQHGFLGSGAWYSYTAANLAEQTNSIVVVTSLSSNPLSCDGCALNGDPMRRAIANLFLDDNPALADSARRAGYTGAMPQRVVLAGHSAGGGLAVAVAGYMIDNGTVGKLAGVLMYDGVPAGNEIPDTLSRLPADIPVYNLAAKPYSWNRDGLASSQLVAARPGEFVGVEVVGGLHSDSVQGGNPLIQFGVYLFTGFSSARNVEAVQTLAAGWVNDMFTGTQDSGLYGLPGQTITIPTSRGTASAIVLPVPAASPSALGSEQFIAS